MKPPAPAAAVDPVKLIMPPELADWAAQPGVTVHRYRLY